MAGADLPVSERGQPRHVIVLDLDTPLTAQLAERDFLVKRVPQDYHVHDEAQRLFGTS